MVFNDQCGSNAGLQFTFNDALELLLIHLLAVLLLLDRARERLQLLFVVLLLVKHFSHVSVVVVVIIVPLFVLVFCGFEVVFALFGEQF
jgi:hypothetical protein